MSLEALNVPYCSQNKTNVWRLGILGMRVIEEASRVKRRDFVTLIDQLAPKVHGLFLDSSRQ